MHNNINTCVGHLTDKLAGRKDAVAMDFLRNTNYEDVWNAIADAVLACKPKPKTKAAKRRKRKAKEI